MSDISIVTAFYDIGRGDWSMQNGHPPHLFRPTETYLERFSYLAELENDITVITSEDMAERVYRATAHRPDTTNIIIYNPMDDYADFRRQIQHIQSLDQFKQRIKPDEACNPEYWNPDYVLVTNLKPFFTNLMIKNNMPKHDMVAWIDFGYCRSFDKIPPSRKWEYDFDPGKIHMFDYKDYDGRPIIDIMSANDVFIFGCKVIAHKAKWQKMEDLFLQSINECLAQNHVDDDQGHWFNAYLHDPEAFELHRIPDHQFGHDSFVLFNEFNNCA